MYSTFAYWYDGLNVHADNAALFAKLQSVFKDLPSNAIIADLGCGTGEMAIRFANIGFDMVCVDLSADMLSVFREKINPEQAGKLLLLQQDLAKLDLYGTVQGAYSVFDTLNHIPPHNIGKAIEKATLFLEKGSYFVFDVNTPYKHKFILADNTFKLGLDEKHHLVWENATNETETVIRLDFFKGQDFMYSERFTEYIYKEKKIEELLNASGFRITEVCDGDSFSELTSTSQRQLFVAVKI